MIVADGESLLILSGEGDVLQPDDGIASIGSGAPYAMAAARALREHTALSATEIVEQAMKIASELCIFTNSQITIETVSAEADVEEAAEDAVAAGEEQA